MLNETWRAWKALENAGIRINLPHPLIKPLPASEKNLLRIRLNDSGRVVSVEDVTVDERKGMWRIVQTSDGSFPVVKVNQPLLDLPAASTVWIELAKSRADGDKLKLLRSALDNDALRTWGDAGWQWSNSLEKAKLVKEKLAKSKPGAGIASLADCFKLALDSDRAVLREMADLCAEATCNGSPWRSEDGVRTACRSRQGQSWAR